MNGILNSDKIACVVNFNTNTVHTKTENEIACSVTLHLIAKIIFT